MCFDDSFHDEKPKTGPLPCNTRLLPKPIKDPRKLLLTNSRTDILNGKLNIIVELSRAWPTLTLAGTISRGVRRRSCGQ